MGGRQGQVGGGVFLVIPMELTDIPMSVTEKYSKVRDAVQTVIPNQEK